MGNGSNCGDSQIRGVPGRADDLRRRLPTPSARLLRVYAFDPQASADLDTAVVNRATLSLPWDRQWEVPLGAGPCNDIWR